MNNNLPQKRKKNHINYNQQNQESEIVEILHHKKKPENHSFFKIGFCHMCKFKKKMVYGCFRNMNPTNCQKKFCLDCLNLVYRQNIIRIIQQQQFWKCPFLRKICKCKSCSINRRQKTFLDFNLDHPISVQIKIKEQNGGTIINGALGRQKFKNLLQENQQLLSKVGLKRIRSEKRRMYLQQLHSNLTQQIEMCKQLQAKDLIQYD